ncbi:MAG: plasmid recombination protein [Clostridia bacterium]|jgi:hypothetical protein|nr:plasmid recombination protein [Clostridia bacterium]
MAYAIMRFAKRKGGQITSLESHNERKKKQYKSNPDIDLDKTEFNYHIIKPVHSYHAEIKKRIASAGCKRRKDSVLMVETLITASPEFFESISVNEYTEYFDRAVQFIKDEIGEKNIITATVHMDERTPHMHICFVPITRDNRLSAKEIIGNQKKLSDWQTKFHDCMSQRWRDLERGISAMKTHRKHIPLWLYKQAQNLDREFAEVKTVIENIGSFNTAKKKEQAVKMLDTWLPKAQKFTAQVKRSANYINTLKKENNDMQDAVDKQGNKIIELLAENSFISQTAKRQERLLNSIPKEKLQAGKEKYKDIIKGLNER